MSDGTIERTIRCPACDTDIELSAVLYDQVRKEVEQRHVAELEGREREWKARHARELADAVQLERDKVREEFAIEHATFKKRLETRDQVVVQLREMEVSMRVKARELEDKAKSLELEVERRLEERAGQVETAVTERIEENHRLKDLEKDRRLADLRRQLEEANRKAQQGSHQLKGDVLEEDVDAALRAAFPTDGIEKVRKGTRGPDVVQQVVDARGNVCGRIVWEVKNTKAFSDSWLSKLRTDQREYHADLAVIVSSQLPEDLTHFELREGVWVTGCPTWLPLAYALRAGLLATARARSAAEGKDEKKEILYRYLSGIEFRQRMEAMVEAVLTLVNELQKERRGVEAGWARREKQLHLMLRSLAGLYGDVSGIVGETLPRIEVLELPEGGEDQEKAA